MIACPYSASHPSLEVPARLQAGDAGGQIGMENQRHDSGAHKQAICLTLVIYYIKLEDHLPRQYPIAPRRAQAIAE